MTDVVDSTASVEVLPSDGPETLMLHGVSVRVRYVSPLLLRDIQKNVRKRVPKPKPPTQVIDGVTESNDAHPDYIEALADWNAERGLVLIEQLARYGVDVDIDAAAVTTLREQAAEDGFELPKDDKVVYVTRILVRNTEDMTAFQNAVLGRSQPTEKAVAEEAETFRGEVPGA